MKTQLVSLVALWVTSPTTWRRTWARTSTHLWPPSTMCYRNRSSQLRLRSTRWSPWVTCASPQRRTLLLILTAPWAVYSLHAQSPCSHLQISRARRAFKSWEMLSLMHLFLLYMACSPYATLLKTNRGFKAMQQTFCTILMRCSRALHSSLRKNLSKISMSFTMT